MGDVAKEMEKHGLRIRRGNVNVRREQAIVERFNRTLGERLYNYQYIKEITSHLESLVDGSEILSFTNFQFLLF